MSYQPRERRSDRSSSNQCNEHDDRQEHPTASASSRGANNRDDPLIIAEDEHDELWEDPDVWDHEKGFIDDNTFLHDTTANQAAQGTDIQGINWKRITSTTRSKYRRERIATYDNFRNTETPLDSIRHEFLNVRTDANFFKFRLNSRTAGCAHTHFQLRNLLVATTKHDVFHMDDFSIYHWNPLTSSPADGNHGHHKPVLSLRGGRVNDFEHGRVVISTMAAIESYILAGGFRGEIVCKNLDTNEIIFNRAVATDDNNITNSAAFNRLPGGGGTQLVISSNDCHVRVFDVPRFAKLAQFQFPWPVNHTSLSPCGKMYCVVGDDEAALIVEKESGKTIGTLKGHIDYSFASAWHPNGYILATGNQDKTTRVWDIRTMGSKSFAVLPGRLGAVHSLRYSSDGAFLAAAESGDFVHVYDAQKQLYDREQEIDLFGEIAGISFTPASESLFIGVSDRTYKSILEFERARYAPSGGIGVDGGAGFGSGGPEKILL